MTMFSDLTTDQWLHSIWAALGRIETNLALPPAPLELPAPIVRVDAPDLTDIVTAVTSLNGTGPTAEEIAAAIADVIRPPTAASPDGAEALGQVARALEKLDFRMQGMGHQAYGGGAVSFAPGQAQAFGEAVQQTTTQTVIASVAATTSVVELGANRVTRSAMTVYNEPGASILYLKFGTGASLTSYSNRLGPGDYWESSPPKYTGPVTAVWDGTTGGARISEFLP